MSGGDDLDGDDDVDQCDYILWALANGMTAADIEAANPGWESYDAAYYKAP